MSRTAPGYEYTGLMAETWDLFRGDTSRWEDRFFYKEAVRRFGEPVLDVGCGTGRLVSDVMTYSGFSFAPARPDDALFTIIGMR